MAAIRRQSLDHLLKSKLKSADRRYTIYRKLLTALLRYERIETTLPRCKDLARVTEKVIDLAKQGDEATLLRWVNDKALIPKIFGSLLDRYKGHQGQITKVYRIPPRKEDTAVMGIIELIGNDLPPMLPSDEELHKLKLEVLRKMAAAEIPVDGTPV